MSSFLPISLKIEGRYVYVIGGGVVGERKIRTLLEFGARVTVISPSLTPHLVRLVDGGRIKHTARKYRPGDLAGAFLAVVATDDGPTNQAVVEEAKSVGVTVNDATDRDGGDFIFPATLKRGDLTISVSTGGISPALAKQIKDGLADLYGEDFAAILGSLNESSASNREGRKLKRAILVIDHGSRLAEANDMLVDVATMIKAASPTDIVHHAHMELADPSIEQGFDACVRDGAEDVIVNQYFLSPGRHSTQDIPRMVHEAASKHPGVRYRVTKPLGLHPKLIEVVLARVDEGN